MNASLCKLRVTFFLLDTSLPIGILTYFQLKKSDVPRVVTLAPFDDTIVKICIVATIKAGKFFVLDNDPVFCESKLICVQIVHKNFVRKIADL